LYLFGCMKKVWATLSFHTSCSEQNSALCRKTRSTWEYCSSSQKMCAMAISPGMYASSYSLMALLIASLSRAIRASWMRFVRRRSFSTCRLACSSNFQ